MDDCCLGDPVSRATGQRHQPVRGGDAHDASRPSGRDEVAAHLLGHEEGPFQIDIEYRLPLRRRHVQRRFLQRNTGIVDQHVEATAGADDLGHGTLDALRGAHIERHRHRARTRGTDARCDLSKLLRARRGHRDVESVAGKCQRNRGADALRGAGHEGCPPSYHPRGSARSAGTAASASDSLPNSSSPSARSGGRTSPQSRPSARSAALRPAAPARFRICSSAAISS